MARGGRREGAGRKVGSKTKNKVTPAIKQAMARADAEGKSLVDMARALTPAALKTLETIMLDPQAPAAARATCANSILDRGWGRAIDRREDVAPRRRSREEMVYSTTFSC